MTNRNLAQKMLNLVLIYL